MLNKNETYYIRVKNGKLYGCDEIGWVYTKAVNVATPEDYVAVIDLMSTVTRIEVVPSDEVAEIPDHAYKRIEKHSIEGTDPSDTISEVLEIFDPRLKTNSRADILRKKLEAFKRAASDLTIEWEGTTMQEEELAGVNVNYPFETSFDELDFESWGVRETELCPIEKAVLWIEANEKDADVRYVLSDDMSYVRSVKELTKILVLWADEWERMGKDASEIHRLIDAL